MTVTKSSDIATNGNLIAPQYDVVIDAGGGGQYTSIREGITAAGTNSSILVQRGTYGESSNIVPLSGQTIHFDDVTVNLSACALYFDDSLDGVRLTGKLILSGDTTIISTHASSRGIDASDCLINPQIATKEVAGNDFYVTRFFGEEADFNLLFDEPSLTSGGASISACMAALLNGNDNCRYKINIRNWNFTDNATTIIGVWVYAADQNVLDLHIQNVATADGNGTGLKTENVADYNSIYGVVRGCDANYTDSGGSHNADTGLAYS